MLKIFQNRITSRSSPFKKKFRCCVSLRHPHMISSGAAPFGVCYFGEIWGQNERGVRTKLRPYPYLTQPVTL